MSSVLTYVEGGCCHWLLGVIMWSCTEAPGPVSYVHFPHCFLLVVILFETIWGRSVENTVCRAGVHGGYMWLYVYSCVLVSVCVSLCFLSVFSRESA